MNKACKCLLLLSASCHHHCIRWALHTYTNSIPSSKFFVSSGPLDMVCCFFSSSGTRPDREANNGIATAHTTTYQSVTYRSHPVPRMGIQKNHQCRWQWNPPSRRCLTTAPSHSRRAPMWRKKTVSGSDNRKWMNLWWTRGPWTFIQAKHTCYAFCHPCVISRQLLPPHLVVAFAQIVQSVRNIWLLWQHNKRISYFSPSCGLFCVSGWVSFIRTGNVTWKRCLFTQMDIPNMVSVAGILEPSGFRMHWPQKGHISDWCPMSVWFSSPSAICRNKTHNNTTYIQHSITSSSDSSSSLGIIKSP